MCVVGVFFWRVFVVLTSFRQKNKIGRHSFYNLVLLVYALDRHIRTTTECVCDELSARRTAWRQHTKNRRQCWRKERCVHLGLSISDGALHLRIDFKCLVLWFWSVDRSSAKGDFKLIFEGLELGAIEFRQIVCRYSQSNLSFA